MEDIYFMTKVNNEKLIVTLTSDLKVGLADKAHQGAYARPVSSTFLLWSKSVLCQTDRQNRPS